MATRSAIAIAKGNEIMAVYCHWDGYLDHNGAILVEHYQDPVKVQQLIDLGDLSTLGPDIGEKHEFESPFKYGTPEYSAWQNDKRKVCTFYGRDRGEEDCGARFFVGRKEYVREMNNAGCEYFYLMEDGVWYVSEYRRPFQKLETAIELDKENEDA